MNHVGLETQGSLGNSAAYIDGWLHALKDDRTMLVKAAGKAEKAVHYILNDSNTPEEQEAPDANDAEESTAGR